MDRRTHLLMLFAFVFARPSAAVADDEASSGSDGGDTETGDSSDDGGEEDDGASGDDGSGGPAAGAGAASSDHEDALKAVQTEGVLSLELFQQRFHQQVEGKIVDVALSKRRGRLIFVVTSIDTDGKVRRRQFDAQTGTLIS